MALSLSVFELCWFEQEEEQNSQLPIIAPYIYDARYHVHPYILSTTVLSDELFCIYKQCVQCFNNVLKMTAWAEHV